MREHVCAVQHHLGAAERRRPREVCELLTRGQSSGFGEAPVRDEQQVDVRGRPGEVARGERPDDVGGDEAAATIHQRHRLANEVVDLHQEIFAPRGFSTARGCRRLV